MCDPPETTAGFLARRMSEEMYERDKLLAREHWDPTTYYEAKGRQFAFREALNFVNSLQEPSNVHV